MSVSALFELLWKDYTARLCPSAHKIRALFESQGKLVNDHIALRTFDLPKVNIDKLVAPFLALGYQPKGHYRFEDKKLIAQHFEHPNPLAPKVFISALELRSFSAPVQQIITECVEAFDAQQSNWFGPKKWPLSYEQYKILQAETEYGAWVAAHGFGANHFTLYVNEFSQLTEIALVNEHLKANGFTVNASGGEIKGTPEIFLEQSSTMADKLTVDFDDVQAVIPAGFYEFAKRYLGPNGAMFSGFVVESADKIFESTSQSG